MCLVREEARRKRWQCGQCTLVRVAWAEPGLPTSGRDMSEDWLDDWWEDWREDWREDLRFLEEVEAEEVEAEVRVLSGSPDTQGAMAATADAEADSSDLGKG